MKTIIIFSASYLYLISILCYLLFLWKSNKKTRLDIIILSILSFPLSFLIAKIAGYFIQDPRPFVTEHIKPLINHVADNGFPSDHVLLTTMIASVIFAYNKKLGVVLCLVSLVIGTARVLASIHHAIDIIGAIIIAVGVTSMVYLLRNAILNKHE